MSNYTITTNFGAKDSLPSGNAGKVIKGSEFTTEFTNIQTAVATKANTVSPTFTGAVTFDAAVTNNAAVTVNSTATITGDLAVDTNTLFVDVSENKVGIGTASPTHQLVVQRSDATLGNASIGFHPEYESGGGSYIRWGGSAVAGGILRFLGVNDNERMRIDSSGNVGIGTDDPQRKLHVQDGDIRIESAFPRLYLTDTNNNSDYSIINNNGNFGIYDDTNAIYRMRIDSLGNVGIGTDSPTGDLTIGRNGNASGGNIMLGSATNNTNKYGVITSKAYNSSTDTEGFAAIATQGTSGTNLVTIGGGIGEVDSATQVRLYTSSASGTRTGTERMRIDSTGNVGIGTTTVGQFASTNVGLTVDSGNDYSGIAITDGSTTSTLAQGFSTTYLYNQANGSMLFGTNNTERMRIDSSGNLLVGKTDTSSTVIGCQLLPTGGIYSVRDDNLSAVFDRKTSDGAIVDLRKDGTTVGSIGTKSADLYIGKDASGLLFDVTGADGIRPFNTTTQTESDNALDLGSSTSRFKDIFRSGSTYSTSDRNKKQDIRDLTDAEARVAVVAKGSLKAFRYINNVEAEGDDANIHFGIIAQDLKAAFEAEGLNADNYQVLKTSTYIDDDGVAQTTYSVCYENLLAFIISAI